MPSVGGDILLPLFLVGAALLLAPATAEGCFRFLLVLLLLVVAAEALLFPSGLDFDFGLDLDFGLGTNLGLPV